MRWPSVGAIGGVVVVVIAALSLVTAPVAMGHTALVSSDPAAEAVLSTGPQRVSATFNEELQPTFAAMTVVGPDGNLWSDGQAEVSGRVVSVGLRPLGPAGRYTANYRVTSADGHVVTGAWSFTVTEAGAGRPGPTVAAAGADAVPDTGTDAASDSRTNLTSFVVAGAVVVAGLAVWLLRRRS